VHQHSEANVSVLIFGIVIALASAARSTWSPCGLSMLSQITPVAEAGRGHRFTLTAAWFVAGATLGGLCLGGAIALGALGFSALGIDSHTAITVIIGCAFAGAAVDAHLLGFGPPFLRRQVNEAWLSNYRSWVYGGGFGWQIGTGVTTYVMTAAVPLLIAVGALSGRARTAVTIGVIFGFARGLAVLLGARLRTSSALFAFHRRFDAWTGPVRDAVIGVQLAVAIAAAWIVAPTVVAAIVSAAAVALMAWSRARSSAPSDGSARRSSPIEASPRPV
jgi:hypothetical protein